MKQQILKGILYSFFYSTVISLTLSWMVYQSTEGLEARQGVFILVILTLVFCILNFLLSLPALLNLIPAVRNSYLFSALAFGGLPALLFAVISTLYIKDKSDYDTFSSFLMIGGPSVVCLSCLTYQFYKFRQTLKVVDPE